MLFVNCCAKRLRVELNTARIIRLKSFLNRRFQRAGGDNPGFGFNLLEFKLAFLKLFTYAIEV